MTMGLFLVSSVVFAHGYLGKRFFPSAITVDEAFIADKLVVPIYYTESNPDATWLTNPKLQYAKSITKNWQLSITSSYLHIQNKHANSLNGFDNFEIGARYNILFSDTLESVFSIGLNSKIGGTGSHVVNAAPYSTISPELLYSQGLSFLPETLKILRPIGFTMSLSPNFITENNSITSVSWGVAIEYSLPYLQQYVINFNNNVFKHLVPLIEFPFTSCTNKNCAHGTTGNIDPGFIIYNRYGQLGLEAIIPSNCQTGHQIGGVIQFYLYLDTIAPNSLGKPIF
jgi:hypothetical protein